MNIEEQTDDDDDAATPATDDGATPEPPATDGDGAAAPGDATAQPAATDSTGPFSRREFRRLRLANNKRRAGLLATVALGALATAAETVDGWLDGRAARHVQLRDTLHDGWSDGVQAFSSTTSFEVCDGAVDEMRSVLMTTNPRAAE